MNTVTNYPSVHLIQRPIGGGHFETHISIATITGTKAVVINDGTAEQLFLALREIFEPGQNQKIADLTSLAYQYADDLRHPPAEDSKTRRLTRIKQVIG